MPYIGNDPVKNASVGTDQLKDDAVTNSKIIDDITFNTGSFSRVESTNYSGEGGALTGVATPASVTSSFAQKSAVSGSFVTSSAFTGNMGDISGSSTSTGSFGRAIISGDVDINSEGGMVGPIAPWVRLNKINLGSSTSELDITTGFGATYDTYMIVCENVHCGTDNVVLRMRVYIDGALKDGDTYNYHVQQSHSGNANYEAGANDYAGATSFINLIAEQGNAAGESCSGIVYIHAASVETFKHYVHYYFVGMRTDSSVNMGRGVGGYTDDTDELTGVRFYYSSGNLDDGTFTLYGLSK